MPQVNSTTKPKRPAKHRTSIGARARAHRWTAAPGGVVVPGPGTYDVELKPAGGLFGRFPEGSGKSDIEWEIYRAQQIPGPADYGRPAAPKPSGGRFNLSKPKNEIDLEIYRAKDIPGPGQYDPKDESFGSTGGGRFNMSKAKTDIEWLMYDAAQKPGAGAYNVPDSFGIGGGVNFACKPIKANYQTTLPDAVLYHPMTVQASPHTAFRRDPSIGKQVVSSQRTEPSFSFGGGKTFDMHEHNIKATINRGRKGKKKGRRNLRKANVGAERGGSASRKKAEADDLFRKFFGYDPTDKSKRGKHALVSTAKKIARPVTTPGPGHYKLPPTMGPSRSRRNAPSFSFPQD